jgi:hypothetical protein
MRYITLPLFFLIASFGIFKENIREMEYNGKLYRTTFNVEQFNGVYSGNKDGYLELKHDGTGTYVYDIFGVAPADCKKGPISFRYGFLLDDNDSLVRMERDYGYSYPILLESIGETSFQGCRTRVMLDFLMVYNDGSVGVSSSDDWIRQD